MDVRAPDGSIARFPDGMSDEAVAAVMRRSYPPQQAQAPERPIIAASAEDYAAQAQPQPQAPQAPSTMDYLRTNPVIGAPAQTVLRAGQGIEQLGAHGLGMIPGMGGIPKAVDEAVNAQNQGYEAAKQRVLQAAPDPRLTNAFIGTGETMGNLVNPAGMAGNAIRATGTVGNAAVRGLVSGLGYGASQPVLGDQSNYAAQKAGQLLTSGGIGAGTGALAQSLTPKTRLPTTAELKAQGGAEYKAIENEPVPVTKEMTSAIWSPYGKTAVMKAVQGAEINREYALAGELRSLLDPQTRPDVISANAADKVSQAFRSLGVKAMKADDNNISRGWFGRRADVETALTAVPEIKQARAVWSQYEKSSTIDEAIQAAKDTARSPAGASDLGQSLRREFGKITKDQDLMGTFSKEEQDAIRRVSDGTFTSNSLQRLGKLSPIRNYFSQILTLLGGYGAGGAAPELGYGALGLVGIGEGARQGAIGATSRQARLASELMRSRFAPQPQTGPSPNVPIGNAATALLSQLLLQPRGQ